MSPKSTLVLLALSYATVTLCPHKPDKTRGTMAEAHSIASHTESSVKLAVSAIPAAADASIKVLKEIPVCAGDTTYNIVAAPFRAGRDGVKYTGQTIAEHPYAFSGTVATLGIVAATIHYVSENFPSREETHRRARLEHEAAEHKHAADSLTTEREFRTCLNTHFRCIQKGKRVPSECNSLAQSFSMLNPAKCEQMIDSANKFND